MKIRTKKEIIEIEEEINKRIYTRILKREQWNDGSFYWYDRDDNRLTDNFSKEIENQYQKIIKK